MTMGFEAYYVCMIDDGSSGYGFKSHMGQRKGEQVARAEMEIRSIR